MLDWLLPPACVACLCLLRADASRGLCSACASELVPAAEHSPGVYSHEGPLRRALSAFKYQRDVSRVGPLAALLPLHDLAFDHAVAVPLHPRRQRSRGFNQSELLLRRALRMHGREAPLHALRRTRPTAPQVGLPAHLRKENVAGAFCLARRAPSTLTGRRVLLFDDVITTGSTLQAAAQPLRAAGAEVTFLALLQAVA
ncbi:MAG: ComF family protein [Nannocystaceae bacterium]|nr:ComF family protein [bacterium]